MKNTISISTIIENAVNNREIPYISLDDSSRMFANAKGAFQVNPDIYYSGRVCAQQEGDQIVAFGKKNLNVDELAARWSSSSDRAHDQRLEDQPASAGGVDRLQLCRREPVYAVRSDLM